MKTSIALSEQRKTIAGNDIETSGIRSLNVDKIWPHPDQSYSRNIFYGPSLGRTKTASLVYENTTQKLG